EGRSGAGSAPVEVVTRMLGGEDLEIGFDDLAEVEGHPLQLGAPPRLDSRQIEKIAHDAPESLRLGVDVPEISPGPLGRHVASEEKLAEPLKRGQRGAQLVSRNGEKFVLGL